MNLGYLKYVLAILFHMDYQVMSCLTVKVLSTIMKRPSEKAVSKMFVKWTNILIVNVSYNKYFNCKL